MPRRRRYDRSHALQAQAHRLIPGGAHTYAKGDDQYPEDAPGFIARGSGCHVWDVDGNEFIEFGMGLRTVGLGHAYPPVLEAVRAQLEMGSNFTRPAPVEIECAEALLAAVPGHDCVKFAKDGSATTSAAVKLARAFTGRDVVAVCADHPFFSSDDWFIGTTPVNAGIPPTVRQLTVSFRYNDLATLEDLFATHRDRIACIIMEAARTEEPAPGYLEGVQALCRREGALFILDEMITGFRWARGGAEEAYGIRSDLATFGKAMANGFALSALVGRRDVMELGGLHHNSERVFLLSTTHGAETHAMAAAIATMHEYATQPVIATLYDRGARLRAGISRHIERLDLAGAFRLNGRDCNLQYATLDARGEPSQEFRTLFLQEMLDRGIIAPSMVVSYSHSLADIDATIAAAAESLEIYRDALHRGVERHLRGRPVKPVYRRFN